MSTERNKQVMKKFVEFINTADVKLSKELISEKAVFYAPTSPDPLRGPSGYMDVLAMMHGGFPNIKWIVEDLIAENDIVAVHFTLQGTHRGNFFGIPATGKEIRVSAMNFYYFEDGKIIKEYGQPDIFNLLQQIGAK
jgi:steroid delta-isomerase-like uncharacterized protein